jgi:hypothetical protein
LNCGKQRDVQSASARMLAHLGEHLLGENLLGENLLGENLLGENLQIRKPRGSGISL